MFSLFVSCEDKKGETSSTFSENNNKRIDLSEDTTPAQTYHLSDYRGKEYIINLNKKILTIENSKRPITLIHILDYTKPLGKIAIENFSKMEKKLNTKVLTLHITVDNASSPENGRFLTHLKKTLHPKENINTLPLTVLYNDGHYYSHFEGDTPIEMIRYDIQQTMKK